MAVLQLDGVAFSFGGSRVFENVDLAVNNGEHIGIVGPNGVGKTTLLRVVAGELEAEAGTISRSRGLRLAFLEQNQLADSDGVVLDALLMPFEGLLELRAEVRRLERSMSSGQGDPIRYGELRGEYDARGGDAVERLVEKLASDLELQPDDLQRSVRTLSGGERRRLALAQTLASSPDVLLLDEPTNHLDLETLERLEQIVCSFKGAVVTVSHDRAFLDATCPITIELGPDGTTRFAGPYHWYVEERERRLESARKSYEKEKTERERQEELVRRTFASGGFISRQAKARQRRLDRLDPLEAPRDVWANMGATTVRPPPAPRSSKVVLHAKGIGASRGGRQLFEDVDLEILRGERIGIIGPNGSGKSTLMTSIMGSPDSGEVVFGHGVEHGLCGQELEELHPETTPIDEIRTIRPEFTTEQIRSHLGLLRIRGDDQERKNRTFSGGERARVALAKLLAIPRNLLALDEPTNNLDIPAREVLEEGLRQFDGAVLVVSHDRYFLNRVVTRMIHIEDGRVEPFWGTYDELRRHLKGLASGQGRGEKKATTEKATKRAQHLARREWRRSCERLQRKVASLEEEISSTEVKIEELEIELEAVSGQWQELERVQGELAEARRTHDELFSEWSKTSEELEAMEKNDDFDSEQSSKEL